ncbi:MAG: hypothetical protein GF421_03985 [Candidatus Aminicenantes bacterium]|nr:hypothetical protein [Candidatus Aminicenantes bacterium]
MKARNFVIPILIMFVLLGALFTSELQAKQEQEKQTGTIPDEVKSVLEQGMESGEARMDIPFTITDHYYLPASQNVYFILLFDAKNADIGYTPVGAPETEETQEQQAFVEKTQELLQCRFNVFLMFKQVDGDFQKEVFIPAGFQVNKDTYDPEKIEMYSTGYILPAGKYQLAMGITQNNYQKIGTQYFEFELPDPAALKDEIKAAPAFFIDDTQKMEQPETKTYIHKGFFTYSILKIKPILKNTFNSGQTSEIFLYVMGGTPDPNTQRFDFSVNYQVLKEGEEQPLIRFAEGNYNSPIIIQPLKFERTVLVQKKKGDEVIEEKREKRDIEPGQYILRLDIKDNISGATATKDVEINIK